MNDPFIHHGWKSELWSIVVYPVFPDTDRPGLITLVASIASYYLANADVQPVMQQQRRSVPTKAVVPAPPERAMQNLDQPVGDPVAVPEVVAVKETTQATSTSAATMAFALEKCRVVAFLRIQKMLGFAEFSEHFSTGSVFFSSVPRYCAHVKCVLNINTTMGRCLSLGCTSLQPCKQMIGDVNASRY